MQTPSLETLAARIEKIERQNRRLKRGVIVLVVLFVSLAGWAGYRSIVDIWTPHTMTQGLVLYQDKPFTFGEMTSLAMGGAVYIDTTDALRGTIGVQPGKDYTGLYFTNKSEHGAGLSVSERGATLTLSDATKGVYLGPGLYDDQLLLLELISHDGRQGIRLGLDGNQQPLFEVIQDGQSTSFLEAATATGATTPPPMRGVAGE